MSKKPSYKTERYELLEKLVKAQDDLIRAMHTSISSMPMYIDDFVRDYDKLHRIVHKLETKLAKLEISNQ